MKTNEETMTGAELNKVITIILAREWNDHVSMQDWNNTRSRVCEERLEGMEMDHAMFEEMLSEIKPNGVYGIEDINYYIGVAQDLHSVTGMLEYINNLVKM